MIFPSYSPNPLNHIIQIVEPPVISQLECPLKPDEEFLLDVQTSFAIILPLEFLSKNEREKSATDVALNEKFSLYSYISPNDFADSKCCLLPESNQLSPISNDEFL